MDSGGQTLIAESSGSSASIARASRQFGRSGEPRVTVDVLLLGFHLTVADTTKGLTERRRCCPALRTLRLAGVSNIDELLKHEEDVIAVSRRVFEAFSPELIEALDTAMGMYTTFGRIVGQDSDSTADVREVNEVGQALGAKNDAELDRIRSTPTSDPVRASLLARLQAAEDRLEAKLDRGVILLQMQRAFSRGVVDLLRQRLTSAVGYQRTVVEGLALLFLTRDDPAKAIEWRKVVTDEDGRRFHAKYQRAIGWIIEAAELTDAYNRASGLTMHLRFAGAIGLDSEKVVSCPGACMRRSCSMESSGPTRSSTSSRRWWAYSRPRRRSSPS